jgi:gluconokinase
MLGARLDLPFLDGDDFHPQANVDKMSRGIPLTDDDRWPWLSILGSAMRKAAETRGGVIATCSALKRIYRTRLSDAVGLPLLYVLLDGSRETLLKRMQARKDHYMPSSLLDSQLAILERPGPDEPAMILSIESAADTIVDELQSSLIALTGDI